MKIYWANSLFNEADQMFNDKCVKFLRKKGYNIYLPQEQLFNRVDVITSSKEIFEVDTNKILDSDILVACIDQETIDSGVACEIGIAWSNNKIIIGLYTDIRQHKKYGNDEGQMYKNLYVIGCIKDKGKIVNNLKEVDKYLKTLRNI